MKIEETFPVVTFGALNLNHGVHMSVFFSFFFPSQMMRNCIAISHHLLLNFDGTSSRGLAKKRKFLIFYTVLLILKCVD